MFQAVCLLGYCVFPINVAALVVTLFKGLPLVFRLSVVIFALLWSTYGMFSRKDNLTASLGFLKGVVLENKKFMVVYPVFLFYLALSWFCMIN